MVHDENRVRIRYLLVIKDSSLCALCFCSMVHDNVKLKDCKFSKYQYDHFNEYEKELLKAYLIHQQQTPKDIFDLDIDSYITNGLYSKWKKHCFQIQSITFFFTIEKKWNTPLDVNLDSRVCNSCSDYVLSMILENRMTSNNCSVDIPGKYKLIFK